MLLCDFTLDTLAAAMRLYLARAYPDGNVPENARVIADLSTARSLKDALGAETVETFESRDRPGLIEKYRWRIGNAFYHHMKLGLECCSEAEDFVFNVATVDANHNKVRLRSSGRIYAQIVAPQTSVLVDTGAQLFGSVVAGTLNVDDGEIHIDEVLFTGAGGGVTLTPVVWRSIAH